MADLKISDDILDSLRSGLQSIADQIKSSSNFEDDIAGLTGHDGLNSKVSSFAGNWSVHRGKMINATVQVHDEVKIIADGFDKLDAQLKGALEKKAD
jgi:hypothetical protein